MKIKSIRLENFMGVTENEFSFAPQKTIVSGANGTGKTTLFDAHLWLWTDYNSGLKSNPPIRPLDGRECIVKVTETIILDSGIECTVAKIQKEKRSKPDENGRTRVTGIINSYEINSVGKTERDFKAEMAERGVNVDGNFLVLSHPEVFLFQKAMDMRKVLFGMAKSHTDKEIADMVPGCEMVSKLLDTYRLDEITAMQKATKKDAEKKLKDIPQQIIGLNKARVEVDVASLEKQKSELEAKVAELEKPIPIPTDDEIANIRKAISEREKQLYELTASASAELVNAKAEKTAEIARMREELHTAELKLTEENNKLNTMKQDGRNEVSKRDELKSRIDFMMGQSSDFGIPQIEAEKFDEKSLSCPLCGRPYKESEQARIRDRWEKEHQSRLENARRMKADHDADIQQKVAEVTESWKQAKKKIDKLAKDVKEQQKVCEEATLNVGSIKALVDKAVEESNAMPVTADMSQNPQYTAIQNTIEYHNGEITKMVEEKQRIVTEQRMRQAEAYSIRSQIEGLNEQLASVDFNRNIDIKIAELEDAQRREGQNQANAERILAQCDAVSRMRNELLTEEINEHFSIVSFKLFDYQKNGEYKETCIPEVRDGSDWKVIGLEANTALSTLGKLDILDGLQKFYGQNLPVFVDFAAELDEKSMGKIQTEMQLIFLVVNNADLEVKGVA